MASEYKPTTDEKRFLRAYRQRQAHETLADCAIAANLDRDWLERRQAQKPEFVTWFKEEARRVNELSLVEIMDSLRDALLPEQRSVKSLHPKLLQLFKDLVGGEKADTTEINVNVVPDPAATRKKIMEYLDGLACGCRCETCQGPKVNWAFLRDEQMARVVEVRRQDG